MSSPSVTSSSITATTTVGSTTADTTADSGISSDLNSYPSSVETRVNKLDVVKQQPQWRFAAPVIYVPSLMFIRLILRKQPVLRDRIFPVGIGLALAHGSYLILSGLSGQEKNNHGAR